jgi:5-(carboxyamino)imidazole ribonucleotide synthase
MLAPGSTIGILGGGQLGRMLAIAAARLGFRCHIFCPEADSPAFDVAAERTIAEYHDTHALHAFAGAVSVVTLEFENVPVATLLELERHVAVAPGSKALAIAQDRLLEKEFVRQLGLETAPFRAVDRPDELAEALTTLGAPAILKTRRLGYDGKGQSKLTGPGDIPSAWAGLKGAPSILEGFVPFRREVSVIATRTSAGAFAAFDVTENEHRNHILARSTVPATIEASTAELAGDAARRIGDGLGYVGTFAVEFFVVGEGKSERVIINEIAPRVHNSGHWTLDAAVSCQFEQHIRAVAGWPLGSPRRRYDCEMLNLVGDEVEAWAMLAEQPATKIHLYGKRETRPGRKMGHATRPLLG